MPMDRRNFLKKSMAATAAFPLSGVSSPFFQAAAEARRPGGYRLLVDTDRVTTPIDERIYGQFLEHINHSVEDGLFAEQIRGAGFEGEDFKTYWESFADRGEVDIADVDFQNGTKSVRLHVEGGRAGIRQGRLFLDAGREVRWFALAETRDWIAAVDASRQELQRANRSRRYRSR